MNVMREIFYGPIKIIFGGDGEQQVTEAGGVTSGYVTKKTPNLPGVKIDVDVIDHLETPKGQVATVDLSVRYGEVPRTSGGGLREGESWPLVRSRPDIRIHHEPAK